MEIKKQQLFSHSASIFPVRDIEEALEFYTKGLGFDEMFRWGEPLEYVVIKRGEVGIHLTRRQDQSVPSGTHTALYIFVYQVDKVYEEFRSKGIEILHPPGNRDYGMRDFEIKDPEGYLLTIGEGLQA